MTAQYNTYSRAYQDVKGASRSLIYLRKSKQVVFYDRAATNAPNGKAVYINTTGKPTIAKNIASWPTQSGAQKVYLTALLGGTLSDNGLAPGRPEQERDWEVVSTVKVDGGRPTSDQFLNVLEFGGSNLTRSSTVLIQSTAGQNFDGALVDKCAVMFMRNWPAGFTSVTYPASGAITQYVSDLEPNTMYSISGAGSPASATSDTAGVLTFVAAGTGSITVTGHSAHSSAQPAEQRKHSIGPKLAVGVPTAVVLALAVKQARSRRRGSS
jgi:hypothetical protein